MISANRPRRTAPRPAGVGDGKTPAILWKKHPLRSVRQRGWGPGRGPVQPPAPLGSGPAGISRSHPDSQAASRARAPRGGRGRTPRQRVRSVDFPSQDGRGEEGRLAGPLAGPAEVAQLLKAGAGEGRPPCSQTLVPPQPASKSDGQTLSPQGRSHVGQRRRHGKGVTSFQGPFRNLPASPDV